MSKEKIPVAVILENGEIHDLRNGWPEAVYGTRPRPYKYETIYKKKK